MNVAVEALIRLVEVLFVIGCCGSLLVILLAGIEDVETIFSRDEDSGAPPVQVEKQG